MNLTLRNPLLQGQEHDDASYKQFQLQTFKQSSIPYNSIQEVAPIIIPKKQEGCFELWLQQFPTFNPDNYIIFFWRLFLSVFVLLYFYLIPVFMFFGYQIITKDLHMHILTIVLSVMIALLIVDCLICFNTGYYDKGLLIADKHKIYKRYLQSQFAFDSIAIFALIMQIVFQDHYYPLIWLPYFFYFKLYFIVEIDAQILSILQLYRKAKGIYQMFRLVLTVLFIINLFSCFFYGAGQYWITQHSDDEIYSSWLYQSGLQNNIYLLPKSVQYEYAFYWAVTTMLTVGYGDVTGKNPLEIFIAIMTMIFACVIFALLISAFQEVFAEINQNNLKFEKKMTDINRFMREKNIDQETQRKVRRFFTFMYSEKVRDFNEQIQTINQLGPQLKDEVIMQSYGVLLRRIYWFSPFSLDLQKKVAYLITEQMYSNGETIFDQEQNSASGNNDDDCLYSISIGGINLLLVINEFNEQSIVFASLEKDQLFGEITFITGNPRSLTAQCTTITRLYKLKRTDFIQILQQSQSDYHAFCMLRDRMMFNIYGAININCFSCQSQKHIAINCSKTHYAPDRIEMIQQLMSQSNQRQSFKRKKIKHDRLNILQIQKASTQMQFRLQMDDSDEEIQTPMTARHFNHQKSLNWGETVEQNEEDIVTQIVNRLENRKKAAYVNIDSVGNFKNYFPKFNILSLIKLQRRERRISRQVRYV